MIKIKKAGFTLSEALITLSIIGVLAALVLPGMIKDATNRANIALVQGTVSVITDAVANEMVRTRAVNLKDTYLFSDAEKFLKTLDCAKTNKNGQMLFKAPNQYKTVNGNTQNLYTGNVSASAILKNGVGIAITPKTGKENIDGTDYADPYVTVVIDINGNKEPNIIGVDVFELRIINYTSTSGNGTHVGDVGSADYSDRTPAQVKANCLGGSIKECYYLLEHSGFDPNYLK